MDKTRFEWDQAKDRLNQTKHGIAFDVAQRALADPKRLILIDLEHRADEQRFYCLGRVGEGIISPIYLSEQRDPNLWRRLLEKREKSI